MARKVILSCALTGGAILGKNSQYVPITPAQIAEHAIDAAKAGAAIVHIHVRDPQTGAPSLELDLYRETVDRIRERNDKVLINLTTGAGGRFAPAIAENVEALQTPKTPDHRTAHVAALKPDICSLDIATMNFGPSSAIVNTPDHLRIMSKTIQASGVKPELEVFDLGQINLALEMLRAGDLPQPPFFQFCLGILGGAPATIEALLAMRAMMPTNAVWSAFGIGRWQMPFVAHSALLGGHVRVGLEDNLYLGRDELAKNNAVLVDKAAGIVSALDCELASPDEARVILGAPGVRLAMAG